MLLIDRKPILVFLALLAATVFYTHDVYAQVVQLVILALSTIPTLAFFYALQADIVTKQVKKSNGEIVMTAINVAPSRISNAQIGQNLGSIPSTVTGTANGPFTLVIPRDAYNTSGAPYTVTAPTMAEFIEAINLCPSNVCTFGGNMPWAFGPTYRKYITSVGTGIWTTTTSPGGGYAAPYPGSGYGYVTITTNGQNFTGYARATSPQCGDGYTLNTSNFKCDLSNILAARSSGATDGVCAIAHGEPDPFDKDCLGLKSDNKLTSTTDVEGNKMTAVADPAGTAETIVARAQPDGGTMISRQKPAVNGTQQREDTTVSRDGVVGATSNSNFTSPGVPAYPGDPGGTAMPGTVGTGTAAVSCGSTGQPACATRIVDGSGKDVAPLTAGDPVGGLGDGPATGASDRLASVKSKASIPVSSACPTNFLSMTLPFPEPIGDFYLSDKGVFCNVMADYQSLIRMVSIAAGFIAALFIVLKA